MFSSVALVAKTHEPAVKFALEQAISTLNLRQLTVLLDARAAEYQPNGDWTVATDSELSAQADLVLSFGGDGTLLQCAGLVYPRDVPLMGVNLGRLGFLTDLALSDVAAGLEAVLDGQFQSENRSVLGCELVRDGKVLANEDGLNDIVIQKWNTARLITLDTYIDGKFVHSQRSDGMIVATPTGSTAYALSGGGPILDPGLGAVVLVPVCPHTLTNRPLVVSDQALIEIHVATDRQDESRLTCDGNSVEELLPGDVVRIFRRERSVRLLHPAEHDHFATLRAKLDWGRAPC